MRNKKLKRCGIAALVLAAALSGLALTKSYAAKKIDLSRNCSIAFALQNNAYEEQKKPEDFAELQDLKITVHLYQVAEVTEKGTYQAAEGFETLKLDAISDRTSAADWAEKAEQAKELLADGASPIAEQELTLVNGSGKADQLHTGMYLIVAEDVTSPYYTYHFKENLISLPNNYYYSSGSDEWVYDLQGEQAVGLKPDREERMGDLVIRKTLSSYNATVGGADFVFQVKVETLDGTIKTNVYKMGFDQPGSDALTISDLPAGAKVTVTEVYSGASYDLVSANDQKATIVAQEEKGNPVSVEFVNAYNGGQNGGSGIENRFYKNGDSIGWENDLRAEGEEE